jgi:DNA-binding MarR family transcriptional regulator
MAKHISINDEVLLNPDLSLAEKGLYGYFWCVAGDDGSCPHNANEICRVLEISPSTFRGHVARLIQLGYISVGKSRRNGHQCNEYFLEGVDR